MADSSSVDEIYDFFKNSHGEVDVTELKKFIESDATINSKCTIFAQKVNAIKQTKFSTKGQFKKYFNQSLQEREHFQAVFGAFDSDRSGQMNKNELTKLLKNYEISVTEDDLNIMFQMCSDTGDVVSHQSLYKFLSS